MWILTETVFERSASVDIIRVSAGVTVTVTSKQQSWTKQSLPQRYLFVVCQLNSDQALRLLCLKGHVRARDSTLWWHRWLEASEFLCTKTHLSEGVEQPKKWPKNPGNAHSDALQMSRFQKFKFNLQLTPKKNRASRDFWNRALHSVNWLNNSD